MLGGPFLLYKNNPIKNVSIGDKYVNIMFIMNQNKIYFYDVDVILLDFLYARLKKRGVLLNSACVCPSVCLSTIGFVFRLADTYWVLSENLLLH